MLEVTLHASVPSEVEPTSLADLIADCAAVRLVLDAGTAGRLVPEPRPVTIPEPAQALVAGLDSYGD